MKLLIFAQCIAVLAACSSSAHQNDKPSPVGGGEILTTSSIGRDHDSTVEGGVEVADTVPYFYSGIAVAKVLDGAVDGAKIRLRFALVAIGCNFDFLSGEMVARLAGFKRVNNRGELKIDVGQITVEPRKLPCMTHANVYRDVELEVPLDKATLDNQDIAAFNALNIMVDHESIDRPGYIDHLGILFRRESHGSTWARVDDQHFTANLKQKAHGERSKITRWYTDSVQAEIVSADYLLPLQNPAKSAIQLVIAATTCAGVTPEPTIVMRYRIAPGFLATQPTYELGTLSTAPMRQKVCGQYHTKKVRAQLSFDQPLQNDSKRISELTIDLLIDGNSATAAMDWAIAASSCNTC